MEKPLDIDVPEQGIFRQLSRDEAVEFFRAEISFFGTVQNLISGSFSAGNLSLGDLRIHESASRELNDVLQELTKGERTSRLEDYVRKARGLRVLIGQGAIGGRVLHLMENGRASEAKWTIALYSPDWFGRDQAVEALMPLRAATVGSPAMRALTDLTSASEALSIADASRTYSKEAAEGLAAFIEEKRQLISELERLYREKLVLEKPAEFWRSIADEKTTLWKFWLGSFAVLIATGMLIIVLTWYHYGDAITRTATTSQGGLSVAGLAAITVPALLFAWLLKNVSRIFLQNLNLADDASHRNALAITYLGLAENPKLSISDQERALILNALFRPIPPHAGDEGPPMGLIDLIRNKAP